MMNAIERQNQWKSNRLMYYTVYKSVVWNNKIDSMVNLTWLLSMDNNTLRFMSGTCYKLYHFYDEKRRTTSSLDGKNYMGNSTFIRSIRISSNAVMNYQNGLVHIIDFSHAILIVAILNISMLMNVSITKLNTYIYIFICVWILKSSW